MIREPLYGFPTSDKLYITQLLPTRYPINITNAFGRHQYNKQCMYVYEVDFWLNIHLMYVGIRQITDGIFIQCMQGSQITNQIFIQGMNGSGGLPIKYSVGVCRDPADYWPNIHLMYEWVRRIVDQIFIWCMQGSGRLPIGYLIVGIIGLSGSKLNIQ